MGNWVQRHRFISPPLHFHFSLLLSWTEADNFSTGLETDWLHMNLKNVLRNLIRMIWSFVQGGCTGNGCSKCKRCRTRGITFLFVSCHVGVQGDERADGLTGLATISECQPKDHTDIINNLKDIERVVILWGWPPTSPADSMEMGTVRMAPNIPNWQHDNGNL